MTTAEEFARLSRQYRLWADLAPKDQYQEAKSARAFLAELYVGALSLPEEFGEEAAPPVSQAEWKTRYERFKSLPFQYYSQCFNPLVVPAEQPVTGDIADDLADIWRDLSEGLFLFDANHFSAAVWQWRHSFIHHWGQHAASALYAFHVWFTENEV